MRQHRRLYGLSGLATLLLLSIWVPLGIAQPNSEPIHACLVERLGIETPTEYEEAIAALSIQHQTFLQSEDKLDEGLTLLCLGYLTYAQGSYPNNQDPFVEARRYFERALIAFEAAKDRANEARAQDWYGRTYFAVNDFINALPQFQTALNKASEANDLVVLADIRYMLGIFYQTRASKGNLAEARSPGGDLDQARENLQIARSLFFNNQNSLGNVDAIFRLAEVEFLLWDVDVAIDDFNAAAIAYNQLGDDDGVVTALHNVARIQHNTGSIREAEVTYQQVLEQYRHLGNAIGEGRVLSALGNIYYQLGYDLAQTTLEEAQRLHQFTGDNYGRVFTLSYLGDVYLANNDISSASASYQSAVELASSLKVSDALAYAYYGRGRANTELAHQGSKQLYDALNDFGEAARLYRDVLGDLYNTRRVFIGQGLAWFTVAPENTAEHEKWLFEAVNKAREVGDKRGEAESLGIIGDVYSKRLDYGTAQSYYDQAIEIAEQISDYTLLANLQTASGKASVQAGDLTSARDAFELAATNYYIGTNTVERAIVINELGAIEQKLGNYEIAIESYEEVVAVLSNLEGARLSRRLVDSTLATTQLHLGTIYLDLGIYRLAEEQLSNASEQFQAVGEGNLYAQSTLALADVAFAQRLYSDAAALYRLAEQSAKSVDNQRIEVLARAGRGSVLVVQGATELQIQEQFDPALELSRQIRDRDAERLILLRYGDALLYLFFNNPEIRLYLENAVEMYYSARNIALERSDLRNAAYALLAAARGYLRDETDPLGIRAHDALEQARLDFQRAGDRGGEGEALERLGLLTLRQASFDRSLDIFTQMRSAYTSINNIIGISRANLHLGQVYQAQRRYEEALRAYDEGLRLIAEALQSNDQFSNRSLASITQGELYMRQGDTLRIIKRYIDAEAALNNADRILGNPEFFAESEYSQLLSARGRLILAHRTDQSTFIRAGDIFTNARRRAEAVNDPFALGLALHGLARVYAFNDDERDTILADQTFSQALAIFRSNAVSPTEAREVLMSTAEFYEFRRLYREAEEYYGQAWNEAHEAMDHVGEGYARMALGLLRANRYRFDEANADLEEAARQFIIGGDQIGAGEALMRSAEISLQRVDFIAALDDYQRALAIFETEEEPLYQAEVQTRIGEVYQRQELLALALDQHFLAQDTVDSAKAVQAEDEVTLASARIEARIQRNIGIIRIRLGQYDTAKTVIDTALRLARESGDLLEEAITEELLAQIDFINREYNNAIETYDRVETTYRVFNLQQRQGELLVSKADAYFRLAIRDDGDFRTQTSNATKYYQQALEIARSLDDGLLEVRALQGLGRVYNWLQRDDEATSHLVTALNIADQLNSPGLLASVQVDLGQIAEENNDTNLAIDYYDQAITLFEDVLYDIRLEAGQIVYASQNILPYHRLVALHMQLGQPEKAFDYAERGRARALLYQVGTDRIDFGLSEASNLVEQVREKHDEIRQRNFRIEELQAQQQTVITDQVIAEGLTSEINQLKDEIEALTAELNRIQEGYDTSNTVLSRVTEIRPRTLEAIQARLGEGVTIVSYYLVPDNSAVDRGQVFAFVVEHNTFRAYELDTSIDFLETLVTITVPAERTSERLSDGFIDGYEVLIQPLELNAARNQLVIVPHGVLNSLPFAALTADGKTFLSDESLLVYTSSVTFYSLLREERSPALRNIVGNAVVYGNPDSPRLGLGGNGSGVVLVSLRHGEEEAESIANLLQVEPMLVDQATESQLLLTARNANLIHISAHGVFRPESPENSFLALASDDINDGDLQVREVYSLALNDNEPLIVLSACDTALGGNTESDDVQSMSQAFLISGARSVIATLWRVDEEATKFLMIRFYQNLIERKLDIADSLREAQQYLRTEYPQWAAPHYWAGFTLVGLPQ